MQLIGRFGYSNNDLQITTQEEDGSTSSRSVPIGAVGVGLELAAQLTEALSLSAAYTHHISDYLKTPYGSQAELDLSYGVSESLLLGLGAERYYREMNITVGDLPVGTISDGSLAGRVHLTYQH